MSNYIRKAKIKQALAPIIEKAVACGVPPEKARQHLRAHLYYYLGRGYDLETTVAIVIDRLPAYIKLIHNLTAGRPPFA